MSKARSTGNIGNIIKTSATCVTVNDGTTDLLIMSGSGTVTIPGNLVVLGGIAGSSAESSSYSLSSSFATNANTLDGIDGSSFLQTGSFNTFSSSIDTTIKNKLNGDGVISGSIQVDITSTTGYLTFSSSLSSSIGSLSSSVATTTSGLSSSIGSLSSSVATNTSGLAGRIGTIEGNYATTGSNIFVGSQVITGSLYITNDMIVQGCSCLQNITASAVSIGTNVVMLNTATPAVRFAGISVQDSGSNAGVTGSIYWDGLCNRWVYSNPSDIGYSGGMLLSGPRTSTLGSESPLTCNYIAKSGGGDHLYDSAIYESGSNIGIGTTTINNKLEVAGNINIPSTNFFRYDSDTGLIGSATSINGGVSTQLGIRAANDILFATNGATERMRISSTGIATFTCQICTVAAVTADLRYTGTGYITYDTSASGTSCLIFRQNGTEKMRISESGYVAVTGNEALSCVPYLQGMSFGWNRTNGQGESMINWTNAGGGTACDLTFNFRDSSTLYERLRIASTGTATFSGNVNVTVANTPEVLLTHSNTSKTFLMAVDGSNAFFRANSTNNILFQYGGGTNALSINGSTGIACFSNTVCANAGLISNTLTISCTSGDDRAMYMSLNCSANYNSGAANTIARSVSSLKFLWYNNCWEIGATRGDDTAIQALVFARQGNTYLAMTCHGIANFTCQVCAPSLMITDSVKFGTITAGTPAQFSFNSTTGTQTTANITDSGNRCGILEIIAQGGAAGQGSGIILGADTWGGGNGRGQIAIKALLVNGSGCGTSDMGFSLRNSPTCSNFTERMRITVDGNLGVGTGGPSAKLHVYSNTSCLTAPTMFLHQFDGNGQGYGHITSVDKNHGIIMRGTPISYLNFGVVAGDQMSFLEYGDDFRFYRKTDANDMQLQVQFSGGVIYARTTAVQSLSDIRTKENIRNSEEGLDIINALRPVRFDFKEGYSDGKKNQLGFIAQEVEEIFPDAVSIMKTNNETESCLKTMGPGTLIPVLVKAIQEQQCTINTLKTCLGIN